MREMFRLWAARIATAAGTAWAFGAALIVVLAWVISGPVFGFSDTWQLVINTGTTIITFLMVFLIQNAQNREAIALQLKLDELLRAVKGARTGLINIDQLSDEDLEQVRKYFQSLGDEKECKAMAEEEAGVLPAGHASDLEEVIREDRRATPDKGREGRG
ncbi:low affinity iron permease family protein [Burkholderia cenocepacia]|uniref:low affinity iron permease family protein n=1 Tax=Burkholderia cenocepacia TaxID=95486 RepID=UPI0022314CAD|nr:low affinity iron permease family protein [Burkholderia cenocepacia]MCW3663989.1 low affinity iron permease family protein [Burkholderia cenocepacia]